MRFRSARFTSSVKRVFIRSLNFKVVPVEAIERKERKSTFDFVFLRNFSKKNIKEILDPRSGVLQGHFYQARDVYRVSDVILEVKQGLIYTPQGSLIEESTSWDVMRVYNSFPWNPRRRIQKFHISNAIVLTSNSFYHWLIEDLPLTINLLELYPDSPVLVAADHPPYVTEFLNMIGRQAIKFDDVIMVDSILMVAKGKDCGWPHSEDLKVLKNYLPFTENFQTAIASKRSYISRKNSSRSPSNESEIEKLFESYGFEILILEKMSLVEQIRAITSSTLIAGIHGAGLTNAVWLSKGSRVLDIVNENYWTECFHRLCSLCEVEYIPFEYSGEIQNSISITDLEHQILEMLK
jgi:hypothetical protein